MKRSDFRFLDRLRVRWAEVDMQKIVFNGHYLMYFDTAVAGYWRAMALPYEQTMVDLQGDLYVRKATLEYEGSARYDEQLDVGIRCARLGTSSFVLEGAVLRGEQRLVTTELVYVFADPVAQTSRPLPQPLREVIEAYEGGHAMTEVRTGTWDELGAQARPIRTAVFVDEQRIPAQLEQDEADVLGVHALAVNRLGRAVGTGRLLPAVDGVAKVGRMAALPTVRGTGIGAAILKALARVARERGDRSMLLHAQSSAIGFYAGQGFSRQGEPFVEAGIGHQAMTRAP